MEKYCEDKLAEAKQRMEGLRAAKVSNKTRLAMKHFWSENAFDDFPVQKGQMYLFMASPVLIRRRGDGREGDRYCETTLAEGKQRIYQTPEVNYLDRFKIRQIPCRVDAEHLLCRVNSDSETDRNSTLRVASAWKAGALPRSDHI